MNADFFSKKGLFMCHMWQKRIVNLFKIKSTNQSSNLKQNPEIEKILSRSNPY